ncbi:MAG: AmmeMemoRadiSam system protein B, partial [Anaerolineae bacterium]|nr:AmmeMemoRadiSam system protein B [Anaerolineae bacterium]NIN94504.1 AmmeMemoRadiSam system protein B [Anaerolineae bacterium]NIQ77572.1 AmmeMemoRadiSam system protein B [Anaerolineae bacterium]
VVAGSFYPGRREDLLKEIERCFKHPLGPGSLPSEEKRTESRVVALISPHAGYVYSGPVA